MAERHPLANADQAFSLSLVRRPLIQAQPTRRCPQQARIPQRLSGRREQQQPGRLRQAGNTEAETVLDPVRDQSAPRYLETAPQLRGGRCPRQLKQREGVAARLGHDPLGDPRVQRARQAFRQQHPRVAVTEPGHLEPGQADQGRPRSPGPLREQQGHRVDLQPPSREAEYLSRGPVEPLDVIDDPQHRLLLSQRRQQAEHRQADQERVWCRAPAQPERHLQGVRLRPR